MSVSADTHRTKSRKTVSIDTLLDWVWQPCLQTRTSQQQVFGACRIDLHQLRPQAACRPQNKKLAALCPLIPPPQCLSFFLKMPESQTAWIQSFGSISTGL